MLDDHNDDQTSLTTSKNADETQSLDSSKDCAESKSEEPKKEFTFSDLAFKKNDKGEMIVNVVNEADFEAETPCSVYNNSSKLEDDYYPFSGKYTSYYHEDYAAQLRVHQPTKADPWDVLNKMVGLDAIKEQLRDVQNRIEFDQKRNVAGLSTSSPSNHFVFYGNPGTGKTEVTRVLGSLFKQSGLLKHGHVVEVDRSDLVGEYIGQTAVKTKEAIRAARGGVLFIDEAYSLFSSYDRDFGHEAISTLVKAMEDERDNMIIVMAGYKHEMDDLIRMNPGLQSRIRHHLHFEDYKIDELVGIFDKFCADDHYKTDDDAEEALRKLMVQAVKLNPERMGNGRFVRNVFEKTLEKMASRVIRLGLDSLEDLQTIRFSDIPKIEDMTGTRQVQKSGSGDNVHPLNT